MRISTPGGMDIGVRPSLEDLLTVLENWRRDVVMLVLLLDWKAGRRKLGRVKDAAFLSRTHPRLGANMVTKEGSYVGGRWCNFELNSSQAPGRSRVLRAM